MVLAAIGILAAGAGSVSLLAALNIHEGFAPLSRRLERGRNRLFDRGISVGNRGNLLVVTSVTAIRDLLT